MSPLIDLIGSAKGYGWGSFVNLPPSFDSISTTTISGSGVTSITFSSIPQTYSHLQIRYWTIAATANNSYPRLRFNGDTASNYNSDRLVSDGTSVTTYSGTTTSQIESSGFTWTAGDVDPEVGIIDIADYANANKYKVAISYGGADQNAGGGVWLASGVWRNTAAITSITIISPSFGVPAKFALYGIKGA